MSGLIYLIYNQSLPGLCHIGACLKSQENERLKALNENYFGEGEFFIIYTTECVNYKAVLKELEENLEGGNKKVPGKNFYKLDAESAMVLIDKYVDNSKMEVLQGQVDENEELAEKYYREGISIYINDSLNEEERNLRAIEKYTKALHLGHPEAKAQIKDLYEELGGYCQYLDTSSEENLLSAVKYYKLAMEFGSDVANDQVSEAYHDLGFMFYIPDDDSEKDFKKAILYFEQSVLCNNSSRSILDLGKIYMEGGHGVQKNLKTAIEYFKRIPGNRKPYYYLGKAYNELGDIRKSLEYYEMWFSELGNFSKWELFTKWEIFSVIDFYKNNNLNIPRSVTGNGELRMRIEEELYSMIISILENFYDGRPINHADPFTQNQFAVLNFFKIACNNA